MYKRGNENSWYNNLLSELWKVKFFILCDVILPARLQFKIGWNRIITVWLNPTRTSCSVSGLSWEYDARLIPLLVQHGSWGLYTCGVGRQEDMLCIFGTLLASSWLLCTSEFSATVHYMAALRYNLCVSNQLCCISSSQCARFVDEF